MTETLGKRILRLRLAAGFRYQQDFAKAVGVNPATMNQIERDKRPPSGDIMERMASVLGCTAATLYNGGPGPKRRQEPLALTTGELQGLVEDASRDVIRAFATALLDALEGRR